MSSQNNILVIRLAVRFSIFPENSAKAHGAVFSLYKDTVSVISLKGHSQLFHNVLRGGVSLHKSCLYSV